MKLTLKSFVCVYLTEDEIHMGVLGVVEIEVECSFCCFAQKLMEKLYSEVFLCNFCNSDGLVWK